MSNKELPGFYRDPKTGKYFRERPNDENVSLKKIKLEREAEVLSSTTKMRAEYSIARILKRRDIGFASGSQVAVDYYRSRMYSKTLLDEIDLCSPAAISNVLFVTSGSKSIFGLWQTQDGYAIGEVPGLYKEPELLADFKIFGSYIQDITEIPNHSVAFIQNGYGETSSINFLRKDDFPDSYVVFRMRSVHQPMYCITTASYTNYASVVIGGINSIYIYNEFAPLRKIQVMGRVMTVCFDDSKNCIISGHSNGQVYIHDLRSPGHALITQIGMEPDKCLVDSYVLTPNKVVFAGIHDKLFTFDIRSTNHVMNFYGHKHSAKKHALSFGNDLLCVNGFDDVIRIWHVSGGNPIHEIRPSNPRNHIAGCIRVEDNKTKLFYFEGATRKIYDL